MGSGAGDIYAGVNATSDEISANEKTVADRHSSRADSKNKSASPTEEDVTTSTSNIEAGITELNKRFTLREDGFLCDRGTGRDESFRQHVGADPLADAREMFEELVGDTAVKPLDNGRGVKAELNDGTYVTFREVTRTPESPAVEIRRSPSLKIKNQKIHFIKGEQ